MKRVENIVIRNELLAAGASEYDALELSMLATIVAQLEKKQSLKQLSWLQFMFMFRKRSLAYGLSAITAAVFIAVVGFTVLAQSSLPGSKLYSVKIWSENSIAMVHPEFKKTMMMRRAQEVKDLIATHASSRLIIATLDDYHSDVRTYKIMDQRVIDYCSNKLRSATPNASPEIKAAIEKAIGTIQNV